MPFAGYVCHNVKVFVYISTPERVVVTFMLIAMSVDRHLLGDTPLAMKQRSDKV